jgi:hypothetical protein
VNNCVFIHTNERQWLGALVSAYSLKRNSAHAGEFDVQFIHTRDHPFLAEREGQEFLRGGTTRVWRMDDLQSFTPLRFMPPELMGYEGRAVIMDPDIFAVQDIHELLTRDMQGAAVMGRHRSKPDKKKFCVATSVMLLDCAKLNHWNAEREFGELFSFERDYKRWICLAYEPEQNVGYLGSEWNDFDHLDENTRLLHNTKRRTQPWKSGLKVDYTPADKLKNVPILGGLVKLKNRWLGEYALLGRYASHPDVRQEQFFFGLLKECLENDVIDEAVVRDEMAQNHVRQDAFEVIDRTPALAH